MKAKKSGYRYWTVVGVCEEQRHCYWILAKNPDEAESLAAGKHEKEGDSRNLAVAGVLKGRRRCLESKDWGFRSQT